MSPVCLRLYMVSPCVLVCLSVPFYKDICHRKIESRTHRGSHRKLFWLALSMCHQGSRQVWVPWSPCFGFGFSLATVKASSGRRYVSIHHGSLGSRCCPADTEPVTDIYRQGQSQELLRVPAAQCPQSSLSMSLHPRLEC